jgi:hypothetical protein
MYLANRLTQADLIDELVAPDGTLYRVQVEWSNKDKAPVAFAEVAGP